jgi:hypothetical protein
MLKAINKIKMMTPKKRRNPKKEYTKFNKHNKTNKSKIHRQYRTTPTRNFHLSFRPTKRISFVKNKSNKIKMRKYKNSLSSMRIATIKTIF